MLQGAAEEATNIMKAKHVRTEDKTNICKTELMKLKKENKIVVF